MNRVRDVVLAKRYVRKAEAAEKAGYGWKLSFPQYKKLMSQKTCAYTGVELKQATQEDGTTSDIRTIDRIDNSIGYVNGNCVAVCHAANQLKAGWENPDNEVTEEFVRSVVLGLLAVRKEKES